MKNFKWVAGLILAPWGIISEEEAAAFLNPQEMANLRRMQHEDFFKSSK